MKTLRNSALVLICVSAVLVGGCNEALKKCRIQNKTQQDRIAALEAELQAANLQLDQLKAKLADAEEEGSIEIDALKQKVLALEEDIAKKEELIKQLNSRLLYGQPLPPELNTMLEEFAQANSKIVSFDSDTGIVKFKSDLLFEKGSATVAPDAIAAVKSLCAILNSEEGSKFDIVIAGHTDDIPIRKPATRAEHPTNWHLSTHRAIAVLNVMTASQVAPERLSVRGFGQYRPLEPNKPNKQGNPKNRRVEIYIVPKGM